jgi:penicillin-binding protein 1A
MQAALKDQPERLPDPPEGMVKVSVSASGRLLPGGEGGIVEWVKAEDLQRMEEEALAEPEAEEQPAEASFDIF